MYKLGASMLLRTALRRILLRLKAIITLPLRFQSYRLICSWLVAGCFVDDFPDPGIFDS